MFLRQSSSVFQKDSKKYNRFFIVLFLSIVASQLQAQNKEKLQSNQELLAKEISLTQKQLSRLVQDRESSLEMANILKHQIQTRDNLIENLTLQIDLHDADLVAHEAEINLMKSQYDRMKTSYKEFVRNFYRTRFQYNPMGFIFSANSIFRVWRRIIFYRSLASYNRALLNDLEQKEALLLSELKELEATFDKKKNTLLEFEKQKSILDHTRKSNKSVIREIQQNEEFLAQRLRAQQAQKRKLDQKLAELVNASIKLKPAISKLPDAIRKLNNAFGANKGKLPWPVSQGYVSRTFGKQRHPELKMIFITNNGIDIITDENEPVMAVFDGNVIAIQSIAGFQKTILINHGTYYSVYANVENVAVSKGESVKRGQTLAYAASSASDISNIHFEIWQGKQLLNPSSWLQKK